MSGFMKARPLRTKARPALQRDEVEFFYFHPQFDDNDAPRVFAYCRSGCAPQKRFALGMRPR